VVGKNKAFTFFQWNIETAGLLLNASRNLFKEPAKADGKYIVFGVPYSQFIRFDSDYRFYRYFSQSSSMAFRAITGLGLPYGNSIAMPFEKSFFVGGANGIRAWIARSLGPGAYRDSSGFRIDQIGDIKLEWNLEFRQKLYGIFETAFFVDAGNIWLRKEDPLRPLASFEFNRFYREIAIGAGLGLRLNFDFFIIRLDAAHPLRDPSYPFGERWAFNRIKTSSVNFNFGIGYPF
jgi:outer membrane protein assembly factor BamA